MTELSQHIELHKIMLKIVSRKGLVRLPHLQTHKKQQVNNNNKDENDNVVGKNRATTPVAWTFDQDLSFGGLLGLLWLILLRPGSSILSTSGSQHFQTV